MNSFITSHYIYHYYYYKFKNKTNYFLAIGFQIVTNVRHGRENDITTTLFIGIK